MKKLSIKRQLKDALQAIEHKDKSINDMRIRIYDLEREQEKKVIRDDYNRKIDSLRIEVERLMEIIRWQINPDTTRYPFSKPKSEIDENDRRVRF